MTKKVKRWHPCLSKVEIIMPHEKCFIGMIINKKESRCTCIGVVDNGDYKSLLWDVVFICGHREKRITNIKGFNIGKLPSRRKK